MKKSFQSQCGIADEYMKTMPIKYNEIKHKQKYKKQHFKIKQLIQDLAIMPVSQIEMQVKQMCKSLPLQLNTHLNSLCSLTQLKYIVLGMMECWQNKQNNQDLRATQKIGNMQNNSQQYFSCASKKTSIYIDFDFTQLLNKNAEELGKKQKLIQRLQNIVIHKDNQINALEQEIKEIKEQFQQIAGQAAANNQGKQKQKQAMNQKIQEAEEENENLKNQIIQLYSQLADGISQDNQAVDQFLRRCLLTQAISIQHFLHSNI